MNIQIGKYKLVGGGLCPEQYDVFLGEKDVAYLRLRHGVFTAELNDGIEIYEAYPRGDGGFHDDERELYLNEAIKAIDAKLNAKMPNVES
jgi:hypothetical protein